ncbi:hypothetical protein [Cupriavidus nantongensis]|uniref:hypothetical protein n=1 Tax=Cupriavidus nantongensis TaxID=1796606 RepID=UPI00358ED3F7
MKAARRAAALSNYGAGAASFTRIARLHTRDRIAWQYIIAIKWRMQRAHHRLEEALVAISWRTGTLPG